MEIKWATFSRLCMEQSSATARLSRPVVLNDFKSPDRRNAIQSYETVQQVLEIVDIFKPESVDQGAEGSKKSARAGQGTRKGAEKGSPKGGKRRGRGAGKGISIG
ncbi:unnamed protein product [Cuscuta epithymum]|uniref:Uncharacterized protein n=1 Tax=Cuscuta epithymum TaxID=186058 RepID=A0AAV0FJB7_9ASTE|nr:unnamed protein product [Cuscuta epithymum]